MTSRLLPLYRKQRPGGIYETMLQTLLDGIEQQVPDRKSAARSRDGTNERRGGAPHERIC